MSALHTGAPPPEKGEALAGDAAQGFEGTHQNSDAESVADADDERKAYLDLRARMALRGFALYELAGGGYLATRWSHTRELPDLRAVAALLRQIGGAA